MVRRGPPAFPLIFPSHLAEILELLARQYLSILPSAFLLVETL
jgi:hypothetical protein